MMTILSLELPAGLVQEIPPKPTLSGRGNPMKFPALKTRVPLGRKMLACK